MVQPLRAGAMLTRGVILALLSVRCGALLTYVFFGCFALPLNFL
jgi:hypothetical protein